MHVTVASGGGLDLQMDHEMAMVKGALLYADHVTLATPTLIEQQALNQWDEETAELVESLRTQFGAKAWGQLVRGRRRWKLGYDDIFTDEYQHIASRFTNITSRNAAFMAEIGITAHGNEELAVAIRSGCVDVAQLGNSTPDSAAFDRAVVAQLRELLQEAPFPMFDLRGWRIAVGGRLRSGRRLELRSEVVESAIASHLLGRLEAFPLAPIDEILDLRSRLEGPRARFVSAIAAAVEELPEIEATDALTRAAEQLFRRDVAPALAELDESLTDCGARATLRRAGSAVVASVGVATAGLLTAPEVIAAATVPVGMSVSNELNCRASAVKVRRTNPYYLLWQLKRLHEAS